jgi:hypothetical protein
MGTWPVLKLPSLCVRPREGDMNSERMRDAYLLDGRRVVIADLIEAGLLEPGKELEFIRPRLGHKYHARVVPDGKIQIADGRSYSSPSLAAVRAVGGGSFDGWHAWRVSDTREPLDTLRQRLLDQALAKSEPESDADETPMDGVSLRHEFLRNARGKAEAGVPLQISVRELIRRWGLASREQAGTDRIEADLENHGLRSDPSFLKVGLDSVISLIIQHPEEEEVDLDVPSLTVEELVETTTSEVGVTLGNLPSAVGGVESITPQASFDEALTKMLPTIILSWQ